MSVLHSGHSSAKPDRIERMFDFIESESEHSIGNILNA